MAAPVALPPFLQQRADTRLGPELVSASALADEMTALLNTWADLHVMLGRALAGEPVLREEARAQLGRLVVVAGESYRRL